MGLAPGAVEAWTLRRQGGGRNQGRRDCGRRQKATASPKVGVQAHCKKKSKARPPQKAAATTARNQNKRTRLEGGYNSRGKGDRLGRRPLQRQGKDAAANTTACGKRKRAALAALSVDAICFDYCERLKTAAKDHF